MNSISLVGRLTKDPKTRNVGELTVTDFALAVDRPGNNNESDFFNIVVWGKQGENCKKYLVKGSLISVKGHLQTRKYKPDWATKEVTIYEVVVEPYGVGFLSSNKSKNGCSTEEEQPSTTQEPLGFYPINDLNFPI